MSLWRTLQDNCGRLYKFNLKGFWGIDLDTKDPQIPNLPLETPEGPPPEGHFIVLDYEGIFPAILGGVICT